MRQFGNGSGSITKVKSTTGKVRYRVRVTLGSEYNEDTGKSKLIQKSLGTYDEKGSGSISGISQVTL